MNVYNIEERKKICDSCPIYNPSKLVCNSKLWLNPNTNEVSLSSRNGFIKGCGCYIPTKIKSLNSHCIAGKW